MADAIQQVQSSKCGRKIMICVDGSSHSKDAFDWYLENVRHDDDDLLVVYAPELHPPAFGAALISAEWHQEIEKHAEKVKCMIHEYEDLIKEKCQAGCKSEVRAVTVNYRVGDALCHEAKTNHVDMIIVGSRGMGLIRRTLIGSVSDYIIHHAHCPVVVTRFK